MIHVGSFSPCRMHRPDAAEDFHADKSDNYDTRTDPNESAPDSKGNKDKEEMDKQTSFSSDSV